ncbi:hypothetical protein MLD38_027323 [Melastoma candidum]|uniref:Uncharacterized protein n=1 Tax=Melastoma candidum TaxID=119954 RepID=A0ACB9P602_9MYRT|nr:hypothetical protein MLD38_027323 [Melastoma candidum]
MKIHPLPTRKRNITIQTSSTSSGSLGKNLRRLPHIFSRVLELPFRSDADVEVEERPEFFRFVAETDDDMGSDVIAHMVEIHPGVTKIVVRPRPLGGVLVWDLDRLELDVWRFRLPEGTRPELASAVCIDGELIVTVPKGEEDDDGDEGEEEDGDVWGGGAMGNDNNSDRLVIVQR